MTNYNWNKDDINNIKNKEVRNIILSEYNSEICNDDSVPLHTLPVKTFKSIYTHEKRVLESYSKELSTISDLLPYTLKGRNITLYEYPHQGFTPDIVLEIIKTFIIELNDPGLLNYFNTLTNPDNHILRIVDYNPDIPITKYIRGRLIHGCDTSYLSYYLKDNITDITCLTHEVSHYFASKIKTNHHFKTFFVEFEAKLMEYLMINYIMSKLNDKELGFTLMQDEINNIITDIHISFYQKLVANTLTNKYDEVKIQKRFNRELNLSITTSPPKNIILNDKINVVKGRVHSAMLALAIVNLINFDYQKGAKLYKNILTDKELDFIKLINKYHLSLQQYTDTFAIYKDPNSLGKILKR